MALFSNSLINWYKSNKRDLPWRTEQDPYLIWLSEILLQQTRVNQGLPYYYKFRERFPNVLSLAEADEQEVLRLWQGLGYYSRARNMHATACFIAENCNGKFPNNYKELLKLKGVGKYTAAAIASFAFGEQVAVLDGNVIRVISRVYGIGGDIRTGRVVKQLQELASELLPESDAHIYNQAIMEFGALHCTPSNPKCDICELAGMCYAYNNMVQDKLPFKSKAGKKKERFMYYYVIESPQGIFMKKRGNNDIWAGLYDFPCSENLLNFSEVQDMEILRNFGIDEGNVLLCRKSDVVKHVLTHQNINVLFWHIRLSKDVDIKLKEVDGQFFKPESIFDLPKPVLINNYLNTYIF